MSTWDKPITPPDREVVVNNPRTGKLTRLVGAPIAFTMFWDCSPAALKARLCKAIKASSPQRRAGLRRVYRNRLGIATFPRHGWPDAELRLVCLAITYGVYI